MRRIPLMAGAVGLLIVSAVPAFAGKPARADIMPATFADPCVDMVVDTAAEPVGRAQITKRGKSGKNGLAQYKVQLKVDGAAPATTWDGAIYVVVDETCTEAAAAQLESDADGDGVVNVKFSAPAGSEVFAVLDAADAINDLATEPFTLEGDKGGKDKGDKGKGKGKDK